MTEMIQGGKITIGRIVVYTLTESDAIQINRRRTTGKSIAKRIIKDEWPIGSQAHIGKEVAARQQFPMVVVSTKPGTFNGQETIFVNGQVLLDGNDVLWVEEIVEFSTWHLDSIGRWQWPARTTV